MGQFWAMGVLAGIGSVLVPERRIIRDKHTWQQRPGPNGWGDGGATPGVIKGGRSKYMALCDQCEFAFVGAGYLRMHMKSFTKLCIMRLAFKI